MSPTSVTLRRSSSDISHVSDSEPERIAATQRAKSSRKARRQREALASIPNVSSSTNEDVSGRIYQTVRIWDAGTGTPVCGPLEGHTNWVSATAFSPDGLHILSGSGDRTVRIWNLAILELAYSQTPASTTNALLPIASGNFKGGWVSSSSKRLMWIPPFLQNDFCMPWGSYVIGPRGVNTLNLSKFVHGMDWERCVDEQLRDTRAKVQNAELSLWVLAY